MGLMQDVTVNSGTPFETITLTLKAGEIRPVYGTIRYLSLVSATNQLAVQVSFTGASFFFLPIGIQISEFDAPQVWVKNTSGVDNVVTLAKGTATLRDNRVVIDSTSPMPVQLQNVTVEGNNVDADPVKTSGVMSTEAYQMGYNGTAWDRLRTGGNAADGEATVALGVLKTGSYGKLWNGATWDRAPGDTGGAYVKGAITAGSAHGTVKPLLIGASDGTNASTVRIGTSTTNGGTTVPAVVVRPFSATDGTNTMPTMDAVARKGFQQLTDGTTAVGVISGTTALKTDLSSVAGTATVTGGVSGVQAVAGNVAHSSATTCNPLGISGRVFTSPDTTLAANDVCWHTMTSGGALLTTPYGLPEVQWQYAAAASGIVNTTTAVTFKAAAGAGLRNYCTSIDIMWEALTNATELAIRDGASGTVIWRTKIPSGVAGSKSVTFPVPLKGTAATLMEVVTLTASVAGAVYFNATGFVAP